MPFPVIAAIGAGASLLGQGINAMSVSGANRASERFQRQMYDRQRSDALADWNRQNEYNSPLQQMLRFKEAGLNPNLIYGTGASSSNSQPVRSSNSGSYRAEPAQFDIGGVFGQFMSLALQNIQISNQEKLLDLRKQQEKLNEVGIGIKGLDLEAKSALLPINLKKAEEEVRNLEMRTTVGYNQDNREWTKIKLFEEMSHIQRQEIEARIKMIGQNIAQSNQAIAESQQRIAKMAMDMGLTQRQTQHVILSAMNLIRDGKIKQFEVDLIDAGVKSSWLEKAGSTILDILGSQARRVIGNKK